MLLPPGREWLDIIIGAIVLAIISRTLGSGAVHTANVPGVFERAPDHASFGRAPGTLLVTSRALYYDAPNTAL